ncbi:MAG: serine/threonine protein kinase, partial [Planctomycetes bacterium]|nr:serine/threonine protein kinase [Planctomycetota bacterium]
MRVSLAVLAVVLLVTLLPAQNSTRKLRREPGEVAGRVGSAVPWAETVQAALASSKESGKPVFWYVPSVAGSPMDRKPEIDRYLRGGPFSWPSTIALLQTRFVCVDEVPRGELQARFGLRRNEFIEPGYLVLDATGKVLAKVDQITTLHPQWFEAPLRRLVGVFQRVCEAIAYAHGRGVVHRDLKPANVLVGELGDVQVVDWGLAKVLDAPSGERDWDEDPVPTEVVLGGDTDATRAGLIVGTPAYMPPERAAGEGEAGVRGDVYSLGAMLYEILSGRAPFEGDSGREVLDLVR